MRSLATIAVVAGLIVTVAIPAYGALRVDTQAKTLQQVAEDGAQSLIVASEAQASTLQRDTYSATTPQEIEKKKAAAAAAERARQGIGSVAFLDIDLTMIGPGSGNIRWPLAKVNHIGEGYGARGGHHHGIDLIADGGSPIFAATDGVVTLSTEGYSTYGVCVMITTVIDGKKVTTLYAHMRYGSRVVKQGQRVEAGQLIGLVGSTGLSTGNHLHFEVFLNGSNVDPLKWLRANAH